MSAEPNVVIQPKQELVAVIMPLMPDVPAAVEDDSERHRMLAGVIKRGFEQQLRKELRKADAQFDINKVFKIDEKEQTLLTYAVGRQSFVCSLILLAQQSLDVNVKNGDDHTALEIAAGDDEFVAALLKQHDVKLGNALKIAADRNNASSFLALLRRFSGEEKETLGAIEQTYIVAATKRNVDIVTLLLDDKRLNAYCRVIDMVNCLGSDELLTKLLANDRRTLYKRRIIVNAVANIVGTHHTIHTGKTALMIAAEKGMAVSVAALLKHPDIDALIEKNGKTAFDMAINKGRTKCAGLIGKHLQRCIPTGPQAKRQRPSDCVVCMNAQVSRMIMPCKHVCLCDKCKLEGENRLCPVCRGAIASIDEVFLP